MTSKILVADDSQTIQKVVSMTLAGHDFALVECRDLKKLKSSLKDEKFDLVLLDFNLSNEVSGQELVKIVRGIHSDIPIILMVGIFDNIDDQELQKLGVNEKLVKPFNNQKLIQKCLHYTSSEFGSTSGHGTDTEEKNLSHEIDSDESESAEDFDADSQWVVESDVEIEAAAEEEIDLEDESDWNTENSSSGNDLIAREFLGWGMDIPSVIGNDSASTIAEIPPVIAKSKPVVTAAPIQQFEEEEDEDALLPEDEDLSYPDLSAKPKSQLISLDDLELDDEDSVDSEDATDPGFELSEDMRSELQEEIESEVSPDDFWAAEDAKDKSGEEVTTAGSSADPEISRVLNQEDILTSVWDEPTNAPQSSSQKKNAKESELKINEAEIVALLKKELTPVIEKWLKDSYKETIERVAWEIIPDLAENLIREEIKSLANSVRDNQ